MDEGVSKKIDDFFAKYRLRKYPKGQVLILNGETPEYVFHLVKGNVKQYDVTHHGDEIIMNVFKPPAFFPMSLAINKSQNPYIYEADSNIEINQAPADEAVAFIKDNPDVMFDLLSRLYRGVDGMMGRMAHLMSSGAKMRLIYELIIEARRFGGGRTKNCKLKLNEIDLAARAGLSRETISREMRTLVKDGLISMNGRSIIVKDLELLENRLDTHI